MSEKEKKVMESRSPAPGSLGGLRGEDGTRTLNQEKCAIGTAPRGPLGHLSVTQGCLKVGTEMANLGS